MKKISVLFIGILALSLIVLSAVVTNSSKANGADVVRVDGTCFLNDAGVGLFSCTVQRVETPSGEIHYWVKGSSNNPVAATTHVDNASTSQICAFDAPTFEGVVTKSGNIEIQCRN